MGALGVATVVAIVASRVFLAWYAGLEDTTTVAVGENADPCDDWTEWFGLGDCAGGVGSVAALTVGAIDGMAPVLQGLQLLVVNVFLIWAVRGLISGGT